MANAATTTMSSWNFWAMRFLPQGQLSFNIAFMTARNYFHQSQLPTPSSLHSVLAFVMPALLNFLELKYQGKDYSPFDTHPMTMWIALNCLLGYCLTHGIELTLRVNNPRPPVHAALHRSVLLLGSLSLASLASIFFKDVVRPFLYFLCILLSLGDLLHVTIRRLMQGLREEERQVRQTSADTDCPPSNSFVYQRRILLPV